MFPKGLVHPNYRPAVIERPSPGKPLLPGEEPQSPHAEILPPVTVNNEDQEQYYMAQGYIDPLNPASEDYFPQEYPKWVGDVIVNSAEEEAALSPPEPEPEPEAVEVPKEPKSAPAPVKTAPRKPRRKRKPPAKKAS